MQWLVTIGTGLILFISLPLLIVRMKGFARRKRRLRGFGGGIAAGFAVFDPAKARALQVIEIRKEVGHADEGGQGDLEDPAK